MLNEFGQGLLPILAFLGFWAVGVTLGTLIGMLLASLKL